MPASRFSSDCNGRRARPSFTLPAALSLFATSATLSAALPSVAVRVTILPSRQTSMLILSPGKEVPTSAGKSAEPMMRWPFTLRTTSPDFRPALSAGLPRSTLATSAPSGVASLNESAKPWLTSCTVTPSLAWLALPVATIWSLMRPARSIGMANDRPWKPPVWL